MRNPPWIRDELILALDLYFRADRNQLSKGNEEVKRLSQLFKDLDIPPFRTPISIERKLGNFVAVDPDNPHKGLDHGRPDRIEHSTEYRIWNEFSGNPRYLARLAQAIAHFAKDNVENQNENIESDDEYPEGAILTRIHKTRERNPAAVKKKKDEVLSKPPHKLICEVCCFDFAEFYGKGITGDFAECHHKVPLSELNKVTNTKTSDLAIVCANCHRMLHRARPVRTVEQLRQIVMDRRKQQGS